MITDFALSLVFGLAQAFLGFLPEWEPPLDLADQLSAVGGVASSVNNYVPLNLTLICLALIVGYRLLLSAWRLIVFVYDRFPFKAT